MLHTASLDLANAGEYASQLFSSLETHSATTHETLTSLEAGLEAIPTTAFLESLKRLRTPESLYAYAEPRFTPAPRSRVFDLLNPASRPAPLQQLYEACDPIPNFSVFDSFVEPGSSQAKFSNPRFFYKEWAKTEFANQAETAARLKQMKQMKKEKKRAAEKLESGAGQLEQAPAPSLPARDNQPSRPPRERTPMTAPVPAINRPRRAPSQSGAPPPPTPPREDRPPPPPLPLPPGEPAPTPSKKARPPAPVVAAKPIKAVEPSPLPPPPPRAISPPPPPRAVSPPPPMQPPVVEAPPPHASPRGSPREPPPREPLPRESPPREPSPPPPSPHEEATSADPALAKFLMMQKMNLPRGAIEQAMLRASVDPALLFPDYAPTAAPALVIAKPKATAAAAPSSNASMLEAIAQGQSQLKSRPAVPAQVAPTAGNGLMQAILTAKLRKVDDSLRPENRPPPTITPNNIGDGNIASILARRIAIIGEAGEQSDESGGSEWEDDD